MMTLTRFGPIETVPGKLWEPIYRAKEVSGSVIDYAWFCPHCGHEFANRKSCRLHCAGKIGSFTATCLKANNSYVQKASMVSRQIQNADKQNARESESGEKTLLALSFAPKNIQDAMRSLLSAKKGR